MLNSKSAFVCFLVLMAAMLLLSCSTNDIYARGALFESVLRPYPSHPNKLVNQRCAKYDKGKCVELDHKVFDLSVWEDRKQLLDLKFICNVAGQRFGICHSDDGLCQLGPYGKRPCIFCSRPVIVLKRLDMRKDFQYIINSNAICAAQDSFIGQRLFLQ
jgi:hypothetical protein